MKLKPEAILIKDYTYHLPNERIADFPLSRRDASKLLVYKEGSINDDVFRNLSHHLSPPATVIFNNTRVIEARLLFQKDTGGVIELFCLEPWMQNIEAAMQQKESAEWKCMIGGASKWRPGQVLQLSHEDLTLQAHYVEKLQDSFRIRFEWQPREIMFAELLHAFGLIPLPPYIKRKPEDLDKERYQTVFSKHEGSVAAPTAALHFTNDVLDDLRAKGIAARFVTLHVGAGTFKPVKSESIAGHEMHGEPFTVTKETLEALVASEKVVAVGTTSMRTLESLYWLGIKLHHQPEASTDLGQWEAYEWEEQAEQISCRQSLQYLLQWLEQKGQMEIHCRTSIIIVPGYRFKVVDGLITNFHQPQSTLLLLIAAFIGEDWKKVYQHALDNDYRFLSYGDSSLLWRDNSE
jgi:S-adenosylmethionine:tRNA ribosyltransferase-isomerase